MVTPSSDYRRYAQACLELADAALDERARAAFVQMAQVWFRLAEEKTVPPDNLQDTAD